MFSGRLIFTFLTLWVAAPAFAQWGHESELGVIMVDGNSKSQTTNVKQQTGYKWSQNAVDTKANYTASEQNNVKSAESWSASIRYERSINEKLAAFLAQGAEGNRFAGYLQRDNTDIGMKYTFYTQDKDSWFAELGYRSITNDIAKSDKEDTTSNGRAYTEVTKSFREGLSGKLWIEYVAGLEDSEIYFVNSEPSLSVMLSSIFSLKLSYLVKYQNILPAGATQRTDTTFSTALVAKF